MNTVKETAMAIANQSIAYCQNQSCGKCVPCRIGSKRLSELYGRIESGQCMPWDIMTLTKLCAYMEKNSACGTGRSAGNTVLRMLKIAETADSDGEGATP